MATRITLYGLFAALLLAPLSTPAAAQDTEAQGEWNAAPFTTGRSSFTFANWSGPAIPVFAYVPEGIDARTAPILIVMHGAQRDSARYLGEWTSVADEYGFIAIAPQFGREDFETSRQYNLGYIQERGKTRLRPRSDWTFAAIEPLFDQVVAQLGGEQERYTLYGHSAGSQFVHRFLYLMPDARVRRYMIANAGWYTLPTFALDYPFGLNTTQLGEAELRAALAKDVVVLLGDQDSDPAHESLNRTDDAMMQGEHRFARGQYFFAFGQEMARRQGWDFGWTIRIVPGVAHSNGGIALAAGDLVVESASESP